MNRINIIFFLKALMIMTVASALALVTACKNDLATPVITEISPQTVKIGEEMTITGEFFGDEQAEGSILFSTVTTSSVISWSDTEIVTAVPENTVSGTVSVIKGTLSSNPVDFSIVENNESSCELINIYPSSGAAGETVTLSGNGFGENREQSAVYFDGIAAEDYELWNDNTIISVIPETARTGQLQVCVNEIYSNQVSFTVLPVINSIYPENVHYGDAVSLIGTGFGNSGGSVFLGDISADTVYSWTNQVIVFQVPKTAAVGGNSAFVDIDTITSTPSNIDVLWDTFTTTEGLNNTNIYGTFRNDDELWVSTWGGGVNYSDDDGVTWQIYNTGKGLPSNYTRTVELNGTDIWVATNSGLCTSADSGITWTTYTTADGIGNNNILSIAVDPVVGDVWAGTNNGGISKSDDNGANWTNYTIGDGIAGNYVYDICIEDDSTIWIATNAGISFSEDSGNTWSSFTTAQGLSNNACRAVYAEGSVIWAATTDRLNKSINGGQTWTHYTTINGLGANYCLDIAVDGETVWVATNGYGLSVSYDGGGTWTNHTIAHGLLSNLVRSVAINQNYITLGTNSGVCAGRY